MVTPLRQRLGRGGRGTLGTCKASLRVSRKRTARMPPPVGQVSSQRPGQTSACRRGRPQVAAPRSWGMCRMPVQCPGGLTEAGTALAGLVRESAKEQQGPPRAG